MRFFRNFCALFLLPGMLLFSSLPAWALNENFIFSNAKNAYKSQNEMALAEYAQLLQSQNYLLAPYADYWLMLLRLSQADNATVQNF